MRTSGCVADVTRSEGAVDDGDPKNRIEELEKLLREEKQKVAHEEEIAIKLRVEKSSQKVKFTKNDFILFFASFYEFYFLYVFLNITGIDRKATITTSKCRKRKI